MKNTFILCSLLLAATSCHKDKAQTPTPATCDIQQTYTLNATKVTITSGIWGTVVSQEGNCMPVVGPGSTCKTCPASRKVQFYQPTTSANATPTPNTPGFYDSFNTTLVKEVTADNDGFFEVNIPSGMYSVIIIENGKIYAPGSNGQGILNAVDFTAGGLLKQNLMMRYKAVY